MGGMMTKGSHEVSERGPCPATKMTADDPFRPVRALGGLGESSDTTDTPMADDNPIDIGLLPPLAELDHVCPSCSMSYVDVTPAAAMAIIGALPSRYRSAAATLPDELVRRRPDARTWSVIEYACHVRDVNVAFADRIRLALVEEHPTFEPLGNDGRAERFRYGAADVASTLDELELAADRFVELVATLGADDWQRSARRLPGEDRDVLWMVRQTAHEGVHHLGDIEKVIARLGISPPTGVRPDGPDQNA
jgi:hypothetical protein